MRARFLESAHLVSRAFERQDFQAIPPLFASDFSLATADGTILNREQFVSEMMSDSRKAIPPVHVSVILVRISRRWRDHERLVVEKDILFGEGRKWRHPSASVPAEIRIAAYPSKW